MTSTTFFIIFLNLVMLVLGIILGVGYGNTLEVGRRVWTYRYGAGTVLSKGDCGSVCIEFDNEHPTLYEGLQPDLGLRRYGKEKHCKIYFNFNKHLIMVIKKAAR